MSSEAPHEQPRGTSHNTEPFPSYTYVPGITPRPVSDSQGHGGHPKRSADEILDRLASGSRLFQLGFYWEAHEAWETAWIKTGRRGPRADLVKGLIKLAACGVKCLEGNANGARRHARRAAELFKAAAAEVQSEEQPSGLSRDLMSGILAAIGSIFPRHDINHAISTECELQHLIALAEQCVLQPPLLPESRRQEVFQGGAPVLGEAQFPSHDTTGM